MELLQMIYRLIALIMAVYGLYSLILTLIYLANRTRRQPAAPPAWDFTRAPTVTIQLPIFNERYVVERLIDAAARMDYPRDRLQIQVLDDSTDETTALARAAVERYARQGFQIELRHRTNRWGYKAGALEEGLAHAGGEFVAVFDADFVPPSDFLRRLIPRFLENERVGMVQARWGHLNDAFSSLTRAAAMSIDGLFVVEQAARQIAGLLVTFNGSAGVWRRTCIDDAGGWSADTLAEDLDLSVRAQLRGWSLVFASEVVAPAEVPAQINAYKIQQFRWAKGSMQCGVKQLGNLLSSRLLSPVQKVTGALQLTSFIIAPLMVLMLLISVPLAWWQMLDLGPFGVIGVVTMGPLLMYMVSQWGAYPDTWPLRILRLPLLMVYGSGMVVSNSHAVIEALIGKSSAFNRTPKYHIEGKQGGWTRKQYAERPSRVVFAEVVLALYALFGSWVAWRQGNVWVQPYMLTWALGLGTVSLLSIIDTMPSRLSTRLRHRTA